MTRILINDTVRIAPEQAEPWLDWMKKIVGPLVLRSGYIESYQISEIREDSAEDGVSFACQYICPDNENYSEFLNIFDPKIQREQNNRFGGQFGRFRTILDILDEGKTTK